METGCNVKLYGASFAGDWEDEIEVRCGDIILNELRGYDKQILCPKCARKEERNSEERSK